LIGSLKAQLANWELWYASGAATSFRPKPDAQLFEPPNAEANHPEPATVEEKVDPASDSSALYNTNDRCNAGDFAAAAGTPVQTFKPTLPLLVGRPLHYSGRSGSYKADCRKHAFAYSDFWDDGEHSHSDGRDCGGDGKRSHSDRSDAECWKPDYADSDSGDERSDSDLSDAEYWKAYNDWFNNLPREKRLQEIHAVESGMSLFDGCLQAKSTALASGSPGAPRPTARTTPQRLSRGPSCGGSG